MTFKVLYYEEEITRDINKHLEDALKKIITKYKFLMDEGNTEIVRLEKDETDPELISHYLAVYLTLPGNQLKSIVVPQYAYTRSLDLKHLKSYLDSDPQYQEV